MKNPTGELVSPMPCFMKKNFFWLRNESTLIIIICRLVQALPTWVAVSFLGRLVTGLESSEFPAALLSFQGGWGGGAGAWTVTKSPDLYPWDYLAFPALVKFCLPYLHISMIEHGKRNLEKVSPLLLKSDDLCSHLPEKVPYSTN